MSNNFLALLPLQQPSTLVTPPANVGIEPMAINETNLGFTAKRLRNPPYDGNHWLEIWVHDNFLKTVPVEERDTTDTGCKYVIDEAHVNAVTSAYLQFCDDRRLPSATSEGINNAILSALTKYFSDSHKSIQLPGEPPYAFEVAILRI